MLTEKDYCDYETCVALKELGFNDVTQYNFNKDGVRTPRIPLYDAQKWLRDEKQMLVIPLIFADNLIDEDGKIVDRWKYYSFAIYSTSTAEFIRNYDQGEECDSYEEALLEGVKSAIKLLKEEM